MTQLLSLLHQLLQTHPPHLLFSSISLNTCFNFQSLFVLLISFPIISLSDRPSLLPGWSVSLSFFCLFAFLIHTLFYIWVLLGYDWNHFYWADLDLGLSYLFCLRFVELGFGGMCVAEVVMGQFELFVCVCMSLNSALFICFLFFFLLLLFDLLLWIFECAVFLFSWLPCFCSVLVCYWASEIWVLEEQILNLLSFWTCLV